MIVIKNCNGKLQGITISDIIFVVIKNTFPYSYIFMQIALTLPISTASWERSFSKMRKIKYWSRLTMSQDCFSFWKHYKCHYKIPGIRWFSGRIYSYTKSETVTVIKCGGISKNMLSNLFILNLIYRIFYFTFFQY